MRHRITLGIGLLHLVLVILGASSFPFWEKGRVGEWLGIYGRYTGSGRAFNFFAPGIGPSYRARFDLYDAEGNRTDTEVLRVGNTRESDLRLGNIVDMITERMDDPYTRQRLSASLAAKVLYRNPAASRISLRLESWDLPEMEKYRAGERYDWQPVYQVSFNRRRQSE